MTAAACPAPDDCWFGGIGRRGRATGERRGAFHLHWDGANLETVYAPQGRGVTDLEVHRGALWETVRVGRIPAIAPARWTCSSPSQQPRLIHRITGDAFANDPFLPASTYVPAPPSLPSRNRSGGGSELLALDSDGQQIWAAGGGATSGAAAANGSGGATAACRAPRGNDTGGRWPRRRRGRSRPASGSWTSPRCPGTSTAWAAVEPFGQSANTSPRARRAACSADGAAEMVTLPASGPGRGAAAKVAFTGPNEGWMVTTAGWLFHFTDGTAQPRNTDPAYAGTITFRPNEAAEQFIPDTPPADDSELFAPPPVELEQAPAPAAVKRLPALLRRIKTRLRGRTLIVRFTLSRRARVQIIGRRKGRTVARTRARMMRPGRHVAAPAAEPEALATAPELPRARER